MLTDSSQLLGKTLGTCELERLVGRGGMGAVYVARQLRPRRSVAVKVLLPGSALNREVRADFLARFRREADAVAALDHVNIMPVYEYGEQDALAYLVMPYTTGGTLRTVLERRGALPLSEAIPIVVQAAEALDYAHSRGIIHRDIKPGNILFHSDGRVLLADFGLAKVLTETPGISSTGEISIVSAVAIHERGTQPLAASDGALIGTPEYLSPEQATGKPVDRRSDIYALGIVLFQMLTGHVPFRGDTAISTALLHVTAEPPTLASFNPTIPPVIEAIVSKALARRPQDRYATAGDFARALSVAVAGLSARSSSHLNVQERTPISPLVLQSNDTLPEVPAFAAPDEVTLEQSMPWEYKQPHALENTPPPKSRPRRSSPSRIALLSTCLLVLLLAGSAAIYLHLPRSLFAPGGVRPSPTSTSVPTQTPAFQPAPLIKAGRLLYATHQPYGRCNASNGSWSADGNAVITCGASATEMFNTGQHYFAGIFLNTLPNGFGIPDNYVLQAEVREGPSAQKGFGVFFRTQPDPHNGTYSLLLYPDNTWRCFAYDNTTGAATLLASGTASVPLSADSFTPIDIMVQGDTFTFYLAGVQQGTVQDQTYAGGAVGFAVGPEADAFYQNMALYTLAG